MPRRPILCAAVLLPLVAGSVVGVAPSLASAAAPPVKISYAHYDSQGSDRGGNASLNDEYIVIRNMTSTNRSLTGWTLKDRTGYTYRFPAFTLGARGEVRVHTGKGTASSTHRYYNRTWYVWNNDKDVAYLRDARGALQHSCTWTTTGHGYKAC